MKNISKIILSIILVLSILVGGDISVLHVIADTDSSIQYESIELGKEKIINERDSYIKFTPNETGIYRYYSLGNTNVSGYISQGDSILARSTNHDIYYNFIGPFLIEYYLVAGVEYIFDSYLHGNDVSSYSIILEKVDVSTSFNITEFDILEIDIWDSATLSLNYVPEDSMDKIVKCELSDTEVVNIQSTGLDCIEIFACAVGTTTVTITTESGLKDELEIHVNDRDEIKVDEQAIEPINAGDVYYKFIPEEDGIYEYLCYSYNEYIPRKIYDINYKALDCYDSSEYYDITTTYELKGGEVYYLYSAGYGENIFSEYVIKISLKEALESPNEPTTTPDQPTPVLKTEGFTLSDEFLKVLSNTDTSHTAYGPIDKNKDGILTLDEIGRFFSIELNCEGCSITDWSDLKYFSSLQELSLENADFEKIEFNNVNEDSKVYFLKLGQCTNIDKLTGINNFNRLSVLSIGTGEVINCKIFESMEGVASLMLSAPDITEIEALNNTEIVSLRLRSDTLKDIEKLPAIDSITSINISGNGITDLGIIENLKNLNEIYASNNEIDDIEILENYKYLSHIELQDNNIENIDSIFGLEYLKALYLYGNPIPDEARIRLIECILRCENPIIGNVGETIRVVEPNEPIIDMVNYAYLDWESLDNNIAEVDGNYLELKNVGTTKLKFKYDEIEFEYDVIVQAEATETPVPTVAPTETPVPTDSPEPTPTPDATATPELKYGDVDNDGIVCAEDALLVLKHAAKLETLSDDAILVADVTQDEAVDAEDALEILKYAAILIRDFN